MKLYVCFVLFFVYNLVGSSTLKPTWLVQCSNDTDCQHFQNATCMNEFCNCGLMFNVCESKVSVEIKVLGGPCLLTEDCNQPYQQSTEFVCSGGKCRCKPDYREESGYCKKNSASSAFSSKDLKQQIFLALVSISIYLFRW